MKKPNSHVLFVLQSASFALKLCIFLLEDAQLSAQSSTAFHSKKCSFLLIEINSIHVLIIHETFHTHHYIWTCQGHVCRLHPCVSNPWQSLLTLHTYTYHARLPLSGAGRDANISSWVGRKTRYMLMFHFLEKRSYYSWKSIYFWHFSTDCQLFFVPFPSKNGETANFYTYGLGCSCFWACVHATYLFR